MAAEGEGFAGLRKSDPQKEKLPVQHRTWAKVKMRSQKYIGCYSNQSWVRARPPPLRKESIEGGGAAGGGKSANFGLGLREEAVQIELGDSIAKCLTLPWCIK